MPDAFFEVAPKFMLCHLSATGCASIQSTEILGLEWQGQLTARFTSGIVLGRLSAVVARSDIESNVKMVYL